jgi:hypothetical protein
MSHHLNSSSHKLLYRRHETIIDILLHCLPINLADYGAPEGPYKQEESKDIPIQGGSSCSSGRIPKAIGKRPGAHPWRPSWPSITVDRKDTHEDHRRSPVDPADGLGAAASLPGSSYLPGRAVAIGQSHLL